MRTSKLFGLLLAGLSLFALASCNDKEEDVLGFDQAKFLVAPDAIGETSATLIVSVTGNDNATWYGFLTTDTQTDAATVVKSKIAATSVTRHILNGSPLKKIEIDGLRKGGALYRYIVTGLLADGKIYGTPAEYVFETKGEFVANSVGTITYPNPVSEPTTVQFAGFPGTYVYGYFPKAEYSRAALKVKMNEDLATGDYDSADEDKTVTFPITEEGEYVVYAYELDGKGEPTLSCAEYDLVIDNLDFSAYEAFLGSWYVNGSDIQLTFTQKQRGVSYYVSGIPTTGMPEDGGYDQAVAEFDFGTGIVTFREQMIQECTTAYSSYGTAYSCVSGRFVYGSSTYVAYPVNTDAPDVIFTAQVVDGEFVIEPGSCEFGPFADFTTGWYIDGVGGMYNTTDTISLPFTLDAEPAPAEDEYLAWLGTWYDAGGHELTITQKGKNQSFYIEGFDLGESNMVISAGYNSGLLVFNGIEYVDPDADVEYDFCGIADGGGVAYSGVLAYAELAADGKSFDIVGATTSKGETVALQILIYNSGYSLYEDGYVVDLPATFTSEAPVATEEYLAWLGEWIVVRCPEITHPATQDDVEAGDALAVGDEVVDQEAIYDLWTIEQEQLNTSYTVTGIEGLDWAEVSVVFDRTDNSINLYSQQVMDTDYLNVYLVNEYNYGEDFMGYWGDIGYGYIDENDSDHAVIYPYDDYFYSISGYAYASSFRFYGETGSFITMWNEVPTWLPAEMYRYSSSGNAPNSVSKDADSFFKTEMKFVRTPKFGKSSKAIKKAERNGYKVLGSKKAGLASGKIGK